MRYRGFMIDACVDNGVERTDPVTGKEAVCGGYYCRVYPAGDEGYCDQIDDFCLGIGHEIPDNSDESLRRGIREYVDDRFYALQEGKRQIMAERKNELMDRLAGWLVETQDGSKLYEALYNQLGMEDEEMLELGFHALTPYFDRSYYAQTIADYIVDHGSEETENGHWRITFSDLNKRYGVDLPNDSELLQGIKGHLRMGYGTTVTSLKIGKRGVSVDFDPVCCPKVHMAPVMGEAGAEYPAVTSGLSVTPRRWKELANHVLGYVSEYFQDCDLYDILHNTLEMSHEEIEALGFSLSDQYEAAAPEQDQTAGPSMTM